MSSVVHSLWKDGFITVDYFNERLRYIFNLLFVEKKNKPCEINSFLPPGNYNQWNLFFFAFANHTLYLWIFLRIRILAEIQRFSNVGAFSLPAFNVSSSYH